MNRNKILRFTAITAVILLAIYAFSILTDSTRGFEKVDTSVAMQQLKDKNVKTVEIKDREQQLEMELKEPITVKEQEGLEKIITQYPARGTDEIFAQIQSAEPESFNTKVTKDSFLISMLSMLIPMLLFFVVIMFLFSRMQGGSGMGGVFGMGKSRAKELTKDMPKTTFADVAGADEAVEELNEIKDFLQGPARYEQLGAKIPRGVLLYGPPGTGKTLLARAVAGEAGVPFYSISGSDFVEMFVGVGASRVRDLFTQAKTNAPCIIFVDEIDAVGRQRGAGMGGGHDEREQTLNQLLVEMDGFGDRQGVILIAATNRPDILDPALLRPGRFDRQIPVTNPDLAGREHILQVHAKDKPLGPDVDLKSLAKRTAGMSGADLENVLNEAALLTARVNGNIITADALEEATDRVVGGPRRTSKIISEHEKKVTAYHEGGHTLAAWAMKDIERVYKVTILARGRTGGHAMTAAEDDKGMYTQAELFARLVFAMGGRSGEELVFGTPTTGASADIEQATKIARAMVTEYGMSPDLGTVKYGEEQGDPFAGRGGGGSLDYSDEVAATIDRQVKMLISKAHDEAYAILKENRDTLDLLAEKLLEKETLRRPDLEKIFEDVTPRPRLSLFDDWDRYPKDDREPVKTPVELAKERGEEPPKRVDFLSAARQAQQEQQAQQGQPGQPQQSQPGQPPYPQQGFQPRTGSGQDSVDSPVYGGTPPPAGWHAPGWPPADQAPRYSGDGNQSQPTYAQQPQTGQGQPQSQPHQQSGQTQHPQQPQQSSPGYDPTGYQQHPGMSNYGTDRPQNPFSQPASNQPHQPAGDSDSNGGKHGKPDSDNQSVAAPLPNEPLRGFRLPDNERPDHPWKDSEEKDEAPSTSPTQSPLDIHNTDDSTSILPRPENGDEGAHRAPEPEDK